MIWYRRAAKGTKWYWRLDGDHRKRCDTFFALERIYSREHRQYLWVFTVGPFRWLWIFR